MALNQDIRYTNTGPYYNDLGLYDFIKSSRILVNDVNPISGPSDAPNNDKNYWINSTTGDLFENIKGQWFLVYNFGTGGGTGDTGITNIENNGTGVGIFKDIIGRTAHLRSLRGAINQINIIQDTDEIRLLMDSDYKPSSLSLVNNNPLQVGLGSSTFNPNGVLGSPDYIRGSIFVQVGTTDRIWICNNPATQVWVELVPPSVSVKQSAMFFGVPTAVITFPNTNFNNLSIASASVDFSGGATWSTVATGGTVLFRRGPTTATGKRYLVNVKIIIEDAAGITSDLHLYTFRMLQSPSSVVQNGSAGQIALNASSASNRGGNCNMSFIITSNTAATDSYYLQLRGSIPGSAGTPPSIDINELTVTFTEI